MDAIVIVDFCDFAPFEVDRRSLVDTSAAGPSWTGSYLRSVSSAAHGIVAGRCLDEEFCVGFPEAD